MVKIRHITSQILIIILLIVFSTSHAMAGKKNDTLNVAIEEEITHVDKYFNPTRAGLLFQGLAWDSLLDFDAFENKIKPALATEWKWVNDLTIDFTLRKGVIFHDGSSFDADDVMYTFNHVIDPANKVPATRFIKWIKKVEKIGAYEVRIHLNEPWPTALLYFGGVLHINPKGAWDKGADFQNNNPIGTGPYKIIQNDIGKKVVFVKNENYYKESPKGQPTVGKIVIRSIPDFNTQTAELMSGGVDWTYNMPADMTEGLKNHSKLVIQSGPSMRIGFMMMDAAGRSGADSPFTKLKVRQAVAHAIDREAIVKELVKGSSKVVHAACNPVQIGCTENVAKYEFNPVKAKKLLAEAGYPDGFRTSLHASREFMVTEAILAYLDAVGIKAQLHKAKYDAMRTAWQKGEVPFVHTTWGSSSLADISAFTSAFFTMGQDDFARDQEVADLLKAGDFATDLAAREHSYHKAIKIIADKAYWLPLYVYNQDYVLSKDVEFPSPPDGLPRLYSCKWKKG